MYENGVYEDVEINPNIDWELTPEIRDRILKLIERDAFWVGEYGGYHYETERNIHDGDYWIGLSGIYIDITHEEQEWHLSYRDEFTDDYGVTCYACIHNQKIEDPVLIRALETNF